MTTQPTEVLAYSLSTVATKFGYSTKTVRGWIDNGTLPAIRIAGKFMILKEDLDKLIEDSKYTPTVKETK